jgi:hypothetical protein
MQTDRIFHVLSYWLDFYRCNVKKKRIEKGKPVITMNRKSGLIYFPGTIKELTIITIIIN